MKNGQVQFKSVISDQHAVWVFENVPLAGGLKPSVRLCCWESLSHTCETGPQTFLLPHASPPLSYCSFINMFDFICSAILFFNANSLAAMVALVQLEFHKCMHNLS